MERKSWTVDLDGRQHTVLLNRTYFGGRREVVLDGRVMDQITFPMRWRSEQDFEIDGHRAVVRTKLSGQLSPYFLISLEVDGRPLQADLGKSKWEA